MSSHARTSGLLRKEGHLDRRSACRHPGLGRRASVCSTFKCKILQGLELYGVDTHFSIVGSQQTVKSGRGPAHFSNCRRRAGEVFSVTMATPVSVHGSAWPAGTQGARGFSA